MLTKFWEGMGDKLAEKWIIAIMAPSAVFWLGGLVAWIARLGSNTLEVWFANLPVTIQGVVLIGTLVVSAITGSIIQRLVPPILSLLEGYWPHWLGGLRQLLTDRQRRKFTKAQSRWNELSLKSRKTFDDLTPEERDEYAVLDQRLRRFPTQEDQLMPTRIGNILRAAERRPTDKYGLDVIVCWPRLWLVLPESVRTELAEARSSLNTAIGFWLWSILFLGWTILSLWALPIGLVTAFFIYRWVLNSAEVYSDLLEATFDVHRIALYQALHWSTPPQTINESMCGKELSKYLLRGGDCLSKPVSFKYTDQKLSDDVVVN